MIKPVEDMVQEVINGKKQNVLIKFDDGDEAVFEDIAGYRVGDSFIAVITKDETTYVYPTRNVFCVKHENV
jgi:hypothetical protein